jgi:hypothetical protein
MQRAADGSARGCAGVACELAEGSDGVGVGVCALEYGVQRTLTRAAFSSSYASASANTVSGWPFDDAQDSAVCLQSQSSRSCSSTPSGRTVRHDSVANQRQEDAASKPYPSLSKQSMSAPALASAIAVSVWPLTDAECSAVTLHSQNSHSCSSARSGRTVRPDTVAT